MSVPAFKLDEQVIPDHELNRVRRRARIHRPRWSPKTWHPVYEDIVLLSALGYKNTEIAQEKGFTVAHISNILTTPQAKMLMDILIARQRAKGTETLESRLERAAMKSIDRVEEVLNNDEYAIKNPGGIFDRAITMLKVTGKVKEPDKETIRERTLLIPAEMIEALQAGMKLADRAREINRLSSPDRNSIDTTGVSGTVV